MSIGSAWQRVNALLADHCRTLELTGNCGLFRALRELTQGIVLMGSVQLTNAARLFSDDSRHLEQEVKRLSRHLGDRHVDHRRWLKTLWRQLALEVEEFDPIAIDATELAKPYAKHLQHQCIVKDASKPTETLVAGYWCLGAYHWQESSRILCPLLVVPYSQTMPGFLSENDCWDRILFELRQATGGRGVWIIDRGGDRPEVFKTLLTLQKKWIVRLREDRPLIGPDGTIKPAGAWADEALLTRPERGRAVTLPVKLPQDKTGEKLHLVVTTYRWGKKNERWVLLTRGLISHHMGPRQVRKLYARRWRAEDAKRFFGQFWHVEKFLTRSFCALERMLGCITAAGGFLAELQRQSPELASQLSQEVIYWEKPEKVLCYRMARGIQSLAQRHRPPCVLQNA
jgi:hypothetical protein